jgi:mannose-6-phosphate isomerase
MAFFFFCPFLKHLFLKPMIPQNLISTIENELSEYQISIASTDFTRPWGGFFVLNEADADKFIAAYFPTYKKEELMLGNKLSPKILVVGPQQRLSWQYHHRRAEIWRVVQGEIGVVMSETDEQTELNHFEPGDVIVLNKGQRHRLVGLNDWGIVAEIWQHTEPNHPSDEDDIVRLQDDFGR